MKRALYLMFMLVLLTQGYACSSSSDGDDRPAPDDSTSMTTADTTTGDSSTNTDATPDTFMSSPYCNARNLPTQPFSSEAGGVNFGDVAADFTLTTLDGTWNFATEWTGCDTYVFVVYFPGLNVNHPAARDGDTVWESDITEIVTEGADNTHYFFVSYELNDDERTTRVTGMRDRINAIIDTLPASERQAVSDRMHYVTTRVTDIDGSVSTFFNSYFDYALSAESLVDLGDRGRAPAPLPFAFGITRDQKWDAGGSLSPVVGQPPELNMAAYFGHFYNHLANVRQELVETPATDVMVVDEMVTERVWVAPVELPSAEDMRTFDTMEFDISVFCPARNPFACSEWDRIARISLCTDGTEACEQSTEVVRWITPYWRRGERRWIMDASPLLALFKEGGRVFLRIEMGPEWERATERHARMAIRLRSRNILRSIGAERAFTGGTFDADYNSSKEPFTFEVPADATRTELVVILSGHGQEAGNNCAEWCDHRHIFSIEGNTVATIVPEGGVGVLRGCALEARNGVSPGQWGNWAPSRAYWCPGLPVEMQRVVLEGLSPGMHTLDYRGSFAGGDPAGGNIAMSAYVVHFGE